MVDLPVEKLRSFLLKSALRMSILPLFMQLLLFPLLLLLDLLLLLLDLLDTCHWHLRLEDRGCWVGGAACGLHLTQHLLHGLLKLRRHQYYRLHGK